MHSLHVHYKQKSDNGEDDGSIMTECVRKMNSFALFTRKLSYRKDDSAMRPI